MEARRRRAPVENVSARFKWLRARSPGYETLSYKGRQDSRGKLTTAVALNHHSQQHSACTSLPLSPSPLSSASLPPHPPPHPSPPRSLATVKSCSPQSPAVAPLARSDQAIMNGTSSCRATLAVTTPARPRTLADAFPETRSTSGLWRLMTRTTRSTSLGRATPTRSPSPAPPSARSAARPTSTTTTTARTTVSAFSRPK